MNPEDQALTAAHVERLVEVELAHRKEIAALQAIVLELRGRLGEAERLIGYLGELNMADTTFGREFDALQDSFDAFLAYSAHVVQLKNARAHAEESAPPVSTVDSRVAALEARVAALEEPGKAPHAFMSTPYDSVCVYQFKPQDRERCCKLRDDPIHAVPGAAK